MDNRTEQLADGVWRVELHTYVNAYVLANDGRSDADGLTLVDTGTRSGPPRFVRSIRLLGLDPRAIHDVLLTHWHTDHSGGASRFATSRAAPDVAAGAGDLPAVHGRAHRPMRRHAAEQGLLGRLAGRVLGSPAAVPDAAGLADGQRLGAGGGVDVVATPGHTAGHVAFHLPDRGVVLAGDAVCNIWFLSRGPRFLCERPPLVRSSIARLAALPVDVVAVGHGPPIVRDARARLAALAGD